MYPTYVLKKRINDIDEDISGVVKVVVIEILFISIKSFTEILVSLALASIFLWTAYPDVRLGTTSLDDRNSTFPWPVTIPGRPNFAASLADYVPSIMFPQLRTV